MQKGSDYHEKITKIVFQNNSVNDLIWKRLIKITMMNFKDLELNSILWTGKLLKPLKLSINYENVQFQDINTTNLDEDKKEEFFYRMDNLEREVYPEESMSTIMDNMGLYPPLKAVNKMDYNTNVAMLEDYQKKKRIYDYQLEDFYDQKFMNKFKDQQDEETMNILTTQNAGAKSKVDKKNMKAILNDEIKRLGIDDK